MANEDASSSLRIPLIACAVVVLLALLAVVGWTLFHLWGERNIRQAMIVGENESKRLAHVLAQARDLEATRSKLEASLEQRGLDATTRTPSVPNARCPPAPSGNVGPPGFLPWQVTRRSDALFRAFVALDRHLECAMAIERHLPALQREVAALEAQLRELEARSAAAPVASTP